MSKDVAKVDQYVVSEDDQGFLFCSCPAWKFQNKPPKGRTCKHIKLYQDTSQIRELSFDDLVNATINDLKISN